MVDSTNSADTQINRPTSIKSPDANHTKESSVKIPLARNDTTIRIEDIVRNYEVIKEEASGETHILRNIRYIADLLMQGPLYDSFSASQKRYIGQIMNNIMHYYLLFLKNKDFIPSLVLELNRIKTFFEDFNCKGDESTFNLCCVENIGTCVENVFQLLSLPKTTEEQ